MRFPKLLRLLSGVAIVAILAGAAFFTRDPWLTMFSSPESESHAEDSAPPVEEPKVLKLSPQARKNLKLVAKPARPQTYWRTIQVPGEIVDRPGQSDRGVTSPAVGGWCFRTCQPRSATRSIIADSADRQHRGLHRGVE